MPKLLALLLLLCPIWAQAQIFQWTDDKGRVHFSDQPHQGAISRNIQPLNSVSNPQFNMSNSKQVLRVPYQEHHGSMIVQVKVNGVPMKFIVDTGASWMVLSPKMAKQAGVSYGRNSPAVTLQTANGRVRAPKVHLKRVALGGWEQTRVQAVIQPMGMQEDMGLLGMSFLGAYRMSLDHARHMMILEK